MKKQLLIVIVIVLAIFSVSHSEINRKSLGQQEQNASDEMLEKDDIREVAFRYLFGHNASALQKKASVYFLSVNGSNPSKEFLERFKNHNPIIRGKAEANYKKINHYRIFDVNDKPGLIFYVDEIKWINNETIEVEVSYYEGGLSSADYTYQLIKEKGKWVVIKETLNRIS